MKISYLNVLIAILLLATITSFSQTSEQQYACKEIVNGLPTGQTIVLTVTTLPNAVVNVSKSIRPTISSDMVCSYNLTSSPSTIINNQLVFDFTNKNVWFVPFESLIANPVNAGLSFLYAYCECRGGVGGCTVYKTSDNQYGCENAGCENGENAGCCGLVMVYGIQATTASGIGLLIEAPQVNLIQN